MTDDQDLCEYPGQRGPCQNPPTEGERCWIDSHTEDPEESPGSVTDGRGAPEGNDHALGNSGGAPEGNTRAMTHGLHMTAERLLEVMDDRQREEFKQAFLDFRDGCRNDRQAMKLAVYDTMETSIIQNLIDEALHEFVQSGEDPDDGYDRFMQEKIEAAQGFRREIRLGLHYEGNSAQHEGSDSGHDNLDALVQGD
jgi:hypothetical protein